MRKLVRTLSALFIYALATPALAGDLAMQPTPELGQHSASIAAPRLRTAVQIAEAKPEIEAPNTAQPTASYAYDIAFEGLKDKLEDRLRDVSSLIRRAEKPPVSRAALIRRVEADTALYKRALQSAGRYAYKVEHRIDFAQSPILITFTVDPGPVYTLSDYRIEYQNPGAEGLVTGVAALGVKTGGPAASKPVLDARPRLLRQLGEHGYPLAKIKKQRALVNHDDQTLTVVLMVDEGARARIGQVFVAGPARTQSAYIKRVANLDHGDIFDVSRIDEARRRLFKTGLFDGIQINWDDAVDDVGELDVTIVAKERKPRTISFGLNYSTTEGAGADIEWVHRNIFGEDEDLTVTLKAAEIEQSLRTELSAPNYGRLDQRVFVAGEIAREKTETYEEQRIALESGLSRTLGKRWRASAGGVIEALETTENNVTTNNIVLAFPLTAQYDGSDDVFDPSKGYKLKFSVEPAAITLETTTALATLSAGGSVYHDLSGDKTIIAAARGRAAVILGPARDEIPAGRRLYAGGGGSIRGYEHQSVGPLDAGGDPEGGRSLLEFGLELRWRFTEDIGVVPFIDGGSVFEDIAPDFADFQFAAGLGLRYYTPIGPLRLDIAVPLNPRGQDDLFEFYISLGQAF